MVRTFQQASLSAGLFFFFILLSGAGIYSSRVRRFNALSSTHPVEQANCGGTAPYWLGAAQLEAGDSCPMRRDDLSHRRKQPLAPGSTPTEPGL